MRELIHVRYLLTVILALCLVLSASIGFAQADAQAEAPQASSSTTSPEIAIAYTGETHAMIEPCNCPIEPLGGVARRATEIKALRDEFRDLLLLDGGGCFAKGIYDEYTQGDELDKQRTFVALKAMAQMGYDAVCIGDDEFGFGQEAIKWAEKELGLTFVSCNIQKESGEPFVKPLIIKTAGEKRVLIIGVTTPEVALSDNWEAFAGLVVFDPIKSVLKLLKEQQGKFDVAVVLSHQSEEDSEKLAKEVPGIDLVFNSGRRTSMRRSFEVEKTHIVNFDYQGQDLLLARLKPEVEELSQRLSVEDIPLSREIEDDPDAAKLANEFKALRTSGAVKPKVRLDLYMMSFCPHSKPAFRTLFQVEKALGDVVDPHVFYLVRFNEEGGLDALYGEDEIEEDRRRLCIMRTQQDKFLSYVACRDSSVSGTSWEECAASVGIDTAALSECLGSDYTDKMLKSMAARAERLRVNASPTLYINNQRFNERIDKTLLMRKVCTILGPHSEGVPACKDLPECLHDYDCPSKEGMIARCENPGTKDAKCLYDEAVKVPVWLIYDENSVATNQERVIDSTKVLMPGLDIRRIEASSEEGKSLIKQYEIDYLPGYIFGMEAQRAKNFSHLKSAFKKVGDRLVFRSELSGATIVANRPAIRNKLDVFISATMEAGLQGLGSMIEMRKKGELSYPFEVRYILYRDDKGELLARSGRPELQEARRQAAMLMLDGAKFDEYILIRGKEPDNSYWEEPIEKAGFEPAKVKELSVSETVQSKLMSDAKLCEELRVGGALVLLIDNREVVPIANNKMLEDVLKQMAERSNERKTKE
ncbi:MAG: hypothetical protein JW941_07800 [Candidatus Coatesbacteria bacterium]|nr:hypothetical protein [Candidatus Coatesbacteria bacterium]